MINFRVGYLWFLLLADDWKIVILPILCKL